MARLALTLLGGFEARIPAGPSLSLPAKAQALLAYLALHSGQSHPRDKLAALLWGDATQDRARDSLRHTVGALTTALEGATPSPLLREGQTIGFEAALIDVDVAAFERCVAEATPDALERAAAFYRGDLLEGLSVNEAPFEEWLLGERERLREMAVDALAALLAQQVKSDAVEKAVTTAVRLLTLEPLQEAIHRTVMRLHARRGRRAAALKQYQICVAVLQRELGVEPEAETKQLYQDILQQRTRAARRDPDASGLDIASPETAIVGRDLERARLREALAATARGHGQVVTVVGEAGIGKTRLLGELVQEALAQGHRVLLGRSYESTQVLPFAPWVEALRAGDGVADDDGPGALDPLWRAELTRLLPEVRVPGLPSPSDDVLRLFEAVARLVGHLAARHPVALVFEDLHWADDMSVRLLAFLARRIRAAPAMIVLTAREEEVASAPILRRVLAELRQAPHCVDLTLTPLSREDTIALVRALARAGTDDATISRLAAQIWLTSEGNPFVVVETMRTVDDAVTAEPAAPLPLPLRVRQLTAGRLERLTETSRQLLAVAAVVGRELDFDLLRHAAGLDQRSAAESLEELVRRRVLHGVGERFDFVHEWIRDVAYAELLPPRRRVLHGQVAAALEELYASDLGMHYAALGRHHRESEAWDKARHCFERAGVYADAHSAHREAVLCFEQALAALGHLPESHATLGQAVDLHFAIRSSLYPLGGHSRIPEHLRAAETLIERLGDQRRQGWGLRYATEHSWMMGELGPAIASGQRALGIATTLRDFGLEVTTNFCLGQAYHSHGDYRHGIDALGAVVRALHGDLIGERFGTHGPISVFARTWLMWCLAEVGEFGDGILAGAEAIEIAATVDHPEASLAARLGLGRLYLHQGAVDRAVPLLEHCRELGERGDLQSWFAGVATSLGSAYARSGRLAEGLPLLEAAAAKGKSHYALRGHNLGEAYLLAGRANEAREVALRALDSARTFQERGHEAWSLRLLAEIESRDEAERQNADARYREAMALASELGMRPLVARCQLGLREVSRDAGKLDESRLHLTAATRGFREMEMTSWLARAEDALAAQNP